MKRNNEKPIGTLVHEFLRAQGLETPLNEHALIENWYKLMGDFVAKNTGKIQIKNDILYIEIKSPSLRADLMLRRRALVQNLNASVRAQVIKEINFF